MSDRGDGQRNVEAQIRDWVANEAAIEVMYNDPPIHCVDVRNKGRCRFLRIRPKGNGATFEGTDNVHSCFLTSQELRQLASALENIADRVDAELATARDFE